MMQCRKMCESVASWYRVDCELCFFVCVCECVYVLVSGQVKFRVLLESAISKPMVG